MVKENSIQTARLMSIGSFVGRYLVRITLSIVVVFVVFDHFVRLRRDDGETTTKTTAAVDAAKRNRKLKKKKKPFLAVAL